MEWWIILLIIIALCFVAVTGFFKFWASKIENERLTFKRQQVQNWLNNPIGIVYEEWQLVANKYETTDSFKSKYQKMKGNLKNLDYSGIYVLKNLTNDYYYVGQSVNVFKRVNQHFSGKGNGNVYADYKYGQDFQINIIPVEKFRLNEIERQLIKILNASGANGYNISKGIRN